MLRLSGPCDQAEAEALRACEELRPWMRREFGWPLAELGNVRLRKGDLAGAEEAFVAAHEHAWTPHPGLALVRLAQGDGHSALALIREAIDHPFNVPSKERPPFGDLRLAPLLEALAEIASAVGDVPAGREAADGLRAVADAYRTPALVASAALAEARAALSAGDLDAAITSARAAIAGWADVGAPYEAAMARMVLGEALDRSGRAEAARMEWRAARAGFAAFGAAREAERAAERLAEPSSSPREAAPPPPFVAGQPPTRATFRREGELRALALESETVHVRDLKGLRYVERLLTEPGREFHVLDLIAVEHGALPSRRQVGAGPEDGLAPAAEGVGGGLPLLDDRAKAAYRRRLAEVDEDIEEALRNHDPARAELAEADRAYLVAELTRAVGLGHRSRTSGGTSERARTSVARAIRYAIARVAEHHRALAAHLDQHVETGAYCRYVPDARAPVVWEL
jgi:tetratricopeptide (TPR) repeat protein